MNPIKNYGLDPKPIGLTQHEEGHIFTPWVCEKCGYTQQEKVTTWNDNGVNEKDEFGMLDQFVFCGSCINELREELTNTFNRFISKDKQ